MAYFKCKDAGPIPHGSQSFTGTTTFRVPSRVRKVNLYLVGSGGDGGNGCWYKNSSGNAQAQSGGGGGGGYITRQENISVLPGDTIAVTVGSGDTTIVVNGITYTAGKGGRGGDNYGAGGTGQSGGGGGSWSSPSVSYNRAAGGSNGANGSGGNNGRASNGGSGNGQSCYIGEVLFSTGGYGGSGKYSNYNYDPCNAGGANTGNGGDGANSGYADGGRYTTYYGASGGTGFALITW